MLVTVAASRARYSRVTVITFTMNSTIMMERIAPNPHASLLPIVMNISPCRAGPSPKYPGPLIVSLEVEFDHFRRIFWRGFKTPLLQRFDRRIHQHGTTPHHFCAGHLALG